MTRNINPPELQSQLSAHVETKTAPRQTLPWTGKRPNVSPAVLGDRIPEHRRGDYVKARCELDPTGIFFCIPCRQLLHNVVQLDMHTDQGAHVVCRICDAHGAEVIV